MKYIHKIIVLAAFFIMESCSLDEKIYDTNMADSFITSDKDAKALLDGVYQLFVEHDCFKDRIHFYTNWSSDDIGTTTANYRMFNERTVSTSNNELAGVWNGFYRVINTANLLMETLENNSIVSESFKNQAMGELHFIRAVCYFYLVRLYGGVPIHTVSIKGNSDFYTSRNSAEEVYELIFSDFKIATEKCILFSKQPTDQLGHATKGSAQAFLALANLTYANNHDLQGKGETTKYYQLSKNYADSVILSNEYKLSDNYADLWNVDKEATVTKEMVYNVQFTRDAVTANAAARGSALPYYTMCIYRWYVTGYTNGRGTSFFVIQPWFYDLYTTGEYKGDYRSEVSFATRFTYRNEGKDLITYPNIPASNEVIEKYPYLDKYKDPKGLQARNNENDYPLIRYSEVFLIKAEAENELNGPTAEAYTAFNKLRERARKASGTARTTPADLTLGLSKEEFRLKIFNERGIEFVGEGHRWFDGIRMRYLDNKRTMVQYRYETFYPSMTLAAPSYNKITKVWEGGRLVKENVVTWTPKFLIWPIPSSEIDTNPNMTQNSDYGW